MTRLRTWPKREPSSDQPLVPMRPPTSAHEYEAGLSGYMTPYGRSRSLSFCMLTPGPTVTVRWSRSMSVIASMRLMSTRIPWRSGTAPSTRPVPPARGTSGTRALVGEPDDRRHLVGRRRAARPPAARGRPSGARRTSPACGRGCSARSARSARAAARRSARGSSRTRSSSAATVAMSARPGRDVEAGERLQAGRVRDELHQVAHLDRALARPARTAGAPTTRRPTPAGRRRAAPPAPRGAREIAAVISGRSMPRPAPAPEQ